MAIKWKKAFKLRRKKKRPVERQKRVKAEPKVAKPQFGGPLTPEAERRWKALGYRESRPSKNRNRNRNSGGMVSTIYSKLGKNRGGAFEVDGGRSESNPRRH